MPRYGLSPVGRGLLSLALPCGVLGALGGQPVITSIGVFIGLFMVLAYLWSSLELRQVTVSVTAAGDVTAGENLDLRVVAGGPPGLECALGVAGSEVLGVRTPATGKVRALAPNMGRLDAVPVTVICGVPDGVVGAVEHRFELLSEPVFVYPAPLACSVDPAPGTSGSFVDPSGEMAGLREYTPGDRLRDVHWPAVARTGTVLVRDNRSAPSGGPVVVIVPATPAIGLEIMAGHARHAIQILMQRGHSVELAIGSDSSTIRTEVEAWQRLAMLAPDVGTEHSPSEIPALVIGIETGATWQTQT
jgi:uncharacterized protein (DUF58 family)